MLFWLEYVHYVANPVLVNKNRDYKPQPPSPEKKKKKALRVISYIVTNPLVMPTNEKHDFKIIRPLVTVWNLKFTSRNFMESFWSL